MTKVSTRWLVVAGIAVALLVAGIGSRYASGDPDGLTKVSQDHGFASAGTSHDGPFTYGGWSGVVGVVAVLAIVLVLVLFLRRRRSSDEA
jgi:hypothetical protein